MAITTLAAAIWQGQDGITSGDGHWLMVFAGITAFALLLQSLVIVGIAIAGAKVQKDLMNQLAEIKTKLLPLVDNRIVPFMEKTDKLVTELAPQVVQIAGKVAAISAQVEGISTEVRAKLVEFGPTITAANKTLLEANETAREANMTVRQVNLRAREQVVRVNGMVTGVLDATAQMGKSIQQGINVPVREAARIGEGVKVAVQTFLRGKPTRKLAPYQVPYKAPVGTYEPSVAAPKAPAGMYEANGTDPFVADVYAKDKPDLEP